MEKLLPVALVITLIVLISMLMVTNSRKYKTILVYSTIVLFIFYNFIIFNKVKLKIQAPVSSTITLFNAITSLEGSRDGNIGKLVLADLQLAGYDTNSMTPEEIFYAYTDHWIARKGYDDTEYNRAMIWRAGPNGPCKDEYREYGNAVVRLLGKDK